MLKMFTAFKVSFHISKFMGLNLFSYKIDNDKRVHFTTTKWDYFYSFAVCSLGLFVLVLIAFIKSTRVIITLLGTALMSIFVVYISNFCYTKKIVDILNTIFETKRNISTTETSNKEFIKFLLKNSLNYIVYIIMYNFKSFDVQLTSPTFLCLSGFQMILINLSELSYIFFISELELLLKQMLDSNNAETMEKHIKIARLVRENFCKVNQIFQLPLLLFLTAFFFDMMIPFIYFIISSGSAFNGSFNKFLFAYCVQFLWIVQDFYAIWIFVENIERFKKTV